MSITRRDFISGTLIGAGAALLDLPAPAYARNAGQRSSDYHPWTGFGGVGDFARSNGNTWEVINDAHKIRDGFYHTASPDAEDTKEVYDLVVVGAGLSGLAATYFVKKSATTDRSCLILDNHPVFGGNAKENEFLVNGERMLAPQGSNVCLMRAASEGDFREMWDDIGLPRSFEYQQWDPNLKPLDFDRTSYFYGYPLTDSDSVGHFFDDGSEKGGTWHRNIWGNKLNDVPLPETVKRDFHRWLYEQKRYYDGKDFERWLDSMSYRDFLTRVRGLGPEIPAYYDLNSAVEIGLGTDTLSAYFAYLLQYPGMQGFYPEDKRQYFKLTTMKDWLNEFDAHSFPAGNGMVTRYLVKHLIPDAIEGGKSHRDIISGRIRFNALDRDGSQTRLRLSSTVVSVRHDGPPDAASHVRLTYSRGGKLYEVKARAVVMATEGHMNRRIVKDLPDEHRRIYERLNHNSVVCANVALTNWRFLYNLGFTACRWTGGEFGFSCNIRRPMVIGDYNPPLHPDKPTVLTFYAPYIYPGLSAREQGKRGRAELFETSYRQFEQRIRRQMTRLFGAAGFDDKRDIAGIIINRWGHAFVVPEPGLFFGRNGDGAFYEVLRKRHGRITFAHAEMAGVQGIETGWEEALRAAAQVNDVL